MKQIDLTKIIKKYKTGWFALTPDYSKVVGSGASIRTVLDQAKSNGFSQPILMKASKSYSPIAP